MAHMVHTIEIICQKKMQIRIKLLRYMFFSHTILRYETIYRQFIIILWVKRDILRSKYYLSYIELLKDTNLWPWTEVPY